MSPGSNRNTHVLICNGAPAPRRGAGRRRSVSPTVWDLWTYGGGRNVRLSVADITDAMGQRLPDQVIDLLELSTLVYGADQCCRRTPGRRFDYGRRWHRDLHFRVAVRRPDFWSRPEVKRALCEGLYFLTEDHFEFDFSPMHDPPLVQDYLDFGLRLTPPTAVDQVMLMSGGLDSLAGAVQQVLHRRLRVAMVSHRPASHVGKRQRDLVRALGERAQEPPLFPFHIPVTAHKLGLEEHDVTQRSRSFLYASMGAAVAHLYGLGEVWFYENGIFGINLPLCAQEVGGHATRTTHPQTLHGFERILSLVFGRAFSVRNGFFWHTKQDVLEVLQRYEQCELARASVSCSHTRRLTDPAPHCGMCSQCLSRRIAALGVQLGAGDPLEGYRSDPVTADRVKDEERILAERFIGHARDVSKMSAVAEFQRKYAGELSRVYPYLNMPPKVAAEKLFDLHLRHASQVESAVTREMSLHTAERWRGMLGDTSVLSYAFGAGRAARGVKAHPRDRAPGDAARLAEPRLVVDDQTFTASFDGRSCAFQGRSKLLFALLSRVGRRPGQRVTFEQLREAGGVWDGYEASDATVRGAVGRLKSKLRAAGMADLSDSISTASFQSRPFVILDLSVGREEAA